MPPLPESQATPSRFPGLVPLTIGESTIWPPIIQAPMAGYTGDVYREILREYGCPYCCTEMISGKGLVLGGDNSRELLWHPPKDSPLAVQLFGEEPSVLSEAARLVQDPSYGGFEVIDLNMGCPARKVTGPGSGGALLKDLDRAQNIVRAVKDASSVPVTVKMRLGWDDCQDPCDIAVRLEDAGADMLVVHGRTVTQGYSGAADWDAILRVARSVHIPVVGNGDITTAQEALDKATLPGLSGVMVGRAIIGNPFFFRQCLDLLDGREARIPTIREKMETAKDHFLRTIASRGERRGLLEMRKHLAFYLRGVKDASTYRTRLNHESSPERVLQILDTVAKTV
ncbi:MAG: tRNA dihydrouridine synthase DusB [Bacillota bacterium]|jgi:tRNA-dihydrouridine synthase B